MKKNVNDIFPLEFQTIFEARFKQCICFKPKDVKCCILLEKNERQGRFVKCGTTPSIIGSFGLEAHSGMCWDSVLQDAAGVGSGLCPQRDRTLGPSFPASIVSIDGHGFTKWDGSIPYLSK